MKDELNRSYNGGGVVYVLKSALSRSSIQYITLQIYLVITQFTKSLRGSEEF